MRHVRAAGALGTAAGVLGGAAGWWLVRHVRSPEVRAWKPGAGARRRAGGLSVRELGAGEEVVVLLHGITASGDVFGAPYDVLGVRARVVVPDLLGFGRSMDPARADFSLEAHLDALDAMVDSLGLDGVPITLAGHSLGGLLALHWAARRHDVTRVVAFCAPLYRTPAEADERIRSMGLQERLFALESPLASQMCAWMCEHRTAAQWLVMALEPQWPVAIARMGVFHTWPAYLGAMNGVIRNGWEASLENLAASEVPVTLANGGRDRVPVPGRADELAGRHRNVRVLVHPDADHELPISDPDWCLALLG